MTELVLTSNQQLPLRPLVEAALANEVRLLEVGIRRTERRLRAFEATHRMTTKDFVRRFENGELDETLELAEWIGEYRLLQRLSDKTEALRGQSSGHLFYVEDSDAQGAGSGEASLPH